MIALFLLAQAAAAPTTAPPQSHSILHAPCESTDADVVVCARAPERLPLPGDRGPPDGPRRADGDAMSGIEHAADGICASRQKGCTVGVDIFGAGAAAIRLVGKLIDPDSCCERPGEATSAPLLIADAVKGVKRAVSAKPDKSNRVPIALDAPPPPTTGRLSP